MGTFEIRNLTKLWELIATQNSSTFNSNFTPSQVENRWRVLKENYKKVIDNNNKTGRGRKSFKYEKEMNEIYGKKEIFILNFCSVLTHYKYQNLSNKE